MSFFYMTFNRLKYKRTADVDTLRYHGVEKIYNSSTQHDRGNTNSLESKWSYIELIDYSGDSQTMRQGDKLNVFHQFSLVYHHNAYINHDVWEFSHHRPLIYLNISSQIKENKRDTYSLTTRPETISSPTTIITLKHENTTTKR